MRRGTLQIQVTTADKSRLLSLIAEKGIILRDIQNKDDFSMVFTVKKSDFDVLKQMFLRRGVDYRFVNKNAMVSMTAKIAKRFVLLSGILLLLILTVIIPTRIYFIVVEDTVSIPKSVILDICEQNGLRFGADRSKFRSENIKNIMLQQLPELNWVGITTNGCVATVKVVEALQAKVNQDENTVSSIVAVTDGVVDEITVLQGVALCRPGQAVQKGQVLISGYEDLGIVLKATRAKGEVYGHTVRTLDLLTPSQCLMKTPKEEIRVSYSLQIGKNIIKLSKCSGISPTGCDKLYDVRSWVLPGGFTMPFRLIRETTHDYSCESASISEDAFEWLYDYADSYILRQMIAGSVLDQSTEIQKQEAVCILNCRYTCREQLGVQRTEETIYGQNSRTDRERG